MAATAPAVSLTERLLVSGERVLIPVGAVLFAFVLFSLFLIVLGKSPGMFLELLWRGAFGTSFSWQNTLTRTAPLILTALCVAIPAQLGLVIIGGEGALLIGGFAAAVAAIPLSGQPALVAMPAMFAVAALAGAIWIGFVGALRHYRGVNETIASLLLFYIAIAVLNFFVEGPLRSPTDPNKPSTAPIDDAFKVGLVPGLEVHWGFVAGVVLSALLWFVMSRTTFGFAARVTGGNPRAARAQGLAVGPLMVAGCAIAGASAGIAGYFEVAAVLGKANASLIAGYGFTGILVSFLARHQPLAIPFVAILFGGLSAAGGLIQRRMGLPDATVAVFQGLIFLSILVSDTLYGRLPEFWRGRRA